MHPRDEENMVIGLEGIADGPVTFIEPKATTDLFIMNNEGRTVESHRWSSGG